MASVRLVWFVSIVSVTLSGVIPPPWADPETNPCAKESWQFLHWPEDGLCYPIFQQGPCADTHELIFDIQTKSAQCKCPLNLVHWMEDNRCYQPYTQGPCPENYFLHPGKYVNRRANRVEPHRRNLLHLQKSWQSPDEDFVNPIDYPHCKQRGNCPENWVFWPQTELCYPLNSQGPCPNGNIFHVDDSGFPQCGCNDSELRRYYWPISGTCHEHFSQGPCKLGQVFIYNPSSKSTQCACSSKLPNYHPPTNKCYEKFTRGPCGQGQWLSQGSQDAPDLTLPAYADPKPQKASRNTTLVCACLPGHVLNPEDGQCYRKYTQGPCKNGYFFVWDSGKQYGTCNKNPCARNELYFPGTRLCYRVNSRGPCSDGQIVVSDDLHGIGYKGRCGCSSSNVQNYWQETSKCYELETQGPCRKNFVLTVRNSSNMTPDCACPEDKIYWSPTDSCYRPFSQGPCDWNEWFVPVQQQNDIETSRTSPLQYGCQCKPGYEYQTGSNFCRPPSVELLLSLGTPKNNRPYKRRTNKNH